jgi:uncharacterized protein
MKPSSSAQPPFWKRQLLEFLADLRFLGRAMLVILSLMAILYLSTLVMIAVQQERLIFKNRPGFSESMQIWGYQDIPLSLPWQNGVLRAHLFKKDPSDRLVIFFYGNGDNAESCLERLRWMAAKCKASLFVADYSGYGGSTGQPGQAEFAQGYHLWSQLLTDQYGYDSSKRLLWGHSLGGAVAAQFAKSEGAEGLILEATFNNMIDMAGEVYPFMPLTWLCRHPFKTDEVLKHWDKPILIFHSPNDHVIPYDLGQKLYHELLPSCPKVKFFQIEGGHNSGTLENSEFIREQIAKSFPDWFESPAQEI